MFRRRLLRMPHLVRPVAALGAVVLAVALSVVGLTTTSAEPLKLQQVTNTATATATATSAPCQSGVVQVNIQNFSFQPPSVTICPGASVRWTNLDTIIHTSTSDTGVWDSGPIAPNTSFQLTFNTPGVYAYHCTPHPFMMGSINVVAAQTATATPTATRTATATSTVAAATGTPTGTATSTVTPTTPVGATATSTPTATTAPTNTATATATTAPTSTATATATTAPTSTATTTATTAPTSTATATATTAPTNTATATSTTIAPTRTATATATRTATATAPPPSVAGRRIVVVRAFVDFRCDSFFNAGTDVLLPDLSIVAELPDGSRTITTNAKGQTLLMGVGLGAGQSVTLNAPGSPAAPGWIGESGYSLVPCPGTPQRTLTDENFGPLGVAYVDFRYTISGAPSLPTGTAAPTATAGAGGTPTPTVTPDVTVTPTATAADGMTATPTATSMTGATVTPTFTPSP